jgi:hypothetical protein
VPFARPFANVSSCRFICRSSSARVGLILLDGFGVVVVGLRALSGRANASSYSIDLPLTAFWSCGLVA